MKANLLRFSLRTFLLTLFVLCLIGSNLFVSWKWREATSEIRELRDELGYLTVSDRAKLHVVEVPTGERLTWRWRIYAPESRLEVCTSGREIPRDGIPANCSMSPATPGEYTVTAKIQPDSDGDWLLSVVLPKAVYRQRIPKDAAAWLKEKHRSYTAKVAGKGGTESFPTGERIVLLRLRAMVRVRYDMQQDPGDKPADGVMIWFEPM